MILQVRRMTRGILIRLQNPLVCAREFFVSSRVRLLQARDHTIIEQISLIIRVWHGSRFYPDRGQNSHTIAYFYKPSASGTPRFGRTSTETRLTANLIATPSPW